jgi:predicted ribosomally synthesized peptide with nif11-like leader
MSTDQGFVEFVQAAKNNPALLQELKSYEGQSVTATASGWVEAGKKHGYSFDAEEVAEALSEANAETALGEGELSDEQLEEVAGGKGGAGEAVLVLIGTIGNLIDNLTDGD